MRSISRWSISRWSIGRWGVGRSNWGDWGIGRGNTVSRLRSDWGIGTRHSIGRNGGRCNRVRSVGTGNTMRLDVISSISRITRCRCVSIISRRCHRHHRHLSRILQGVRRCRITISSIIVIAFRVIRRIFIIRFIRFRRVISSGANISRCRTIRDRGCGRAAISGLVRPSMTAPKSFNASRIDLSVPCNFNGGRLAVDAFVNAHAKFKRRCGSSKIWTATTWYSGLSSRIGRFERPG